MKLFIILVPYFFTSFVRCADETYKNDENVEIEGDPDDEDIVEYDQTENKWVKDAVVNVAYYLRSHKFNGYDLRFFTERPSPEQSNFYGKFAEPPLKHFHVDTFDNCKDDFTSCLRYLYETVLDAYLQEQPELMHFGEPCDNFASCLPDDKATNNNDIRANDSVPFQCAMYSFCPDPCCAEKLLLATDSCQQTDSKGNPCRILNNPKCSFNKTLNRSFISIVYNEWNVTCDCLTEGYGWNSRYGQCVDYNECRLQSPCDNETEECVNTNGKFVCECKFKFKWSEKEKKCVENDIIMRAMKRFSGIDEESYGIIPRLLIYWIIGGLILTACVVMVFLLVYRSIFIRLHFSPVASRDT